MKCNRCGSEVKKDWQFCPDCGMPIALDFNDMFNNVFNNLIKQLDENPEMMKRLEEMSKQLEKNMEMVDIKPAFLGKPVVRKSGFTINIRREKGKKPKVDIKTFGNAKMQKPHTNKHTHIVRHGLLKKRPSSTSEPKASARRVQRGVEVEVDLPGVKPEDIQINDLHNSIEIRAAKGKKGFFKIIKKPHGTAVRGHRFEKGKLRLLIA